MSLAWRNGNRSGTGRGDRRKAWTIAWSLSLALHLFAFVVLYLIFTPATDPLAESDTIGHLRFAESSPPLEDRPLIRSQSPVALSELMRVPAANDLPLPVPGAQLDDGPRVIGLSGAEDSPQSLAAFGTTSRLDAPAVSFFGSSARGYKIVFVVDRSASMWDQFDRVRAELIAALARLQPSQQFQLIFFSSGSPLQMKPEVFLDSSSANKQAAYDFLQQVARLDPVSGSTDPAPALGKALGLSPGPPDLIFLLSDGDFPGSVLEVVESANPQARTCINTIGFGYQGGAKLLSDLARANRGSFRFVQSSASPEQSDLPLLDPSP